ncbi:hypothetical protein RRG08_039746 [Elysia crispata]|uniref:Uncharacterized protein n=1 Tax=Elysia crispata TaxID=231223 RepID=A0AAE1CVP4_9GAST|nr:hypothetical protein RRG08_039746 [Elysia crispata]
MATAEIVGWDTTMVGRGGMGGGGLYTEPVGDHQTAEIRMSSMSSKSSKVNIKIVFNLEFKHSPIHDQDESQKVGFLKGSL